MARYLDPRNDLTFKRIFGEHPKLLISFLNAVMPFSAEQQIRTIEYLPAEQVPNNPTKKNSIVDVKCRDKKGRVFIIEMQMLWYPDFMNRIVFNAGKAYVKQLDASENYSLLQPVYTLAILNENFDHETEEIFHHYKIVNIENSKEVIEGLQFVLVELIKFKSEKWSHRKIAALWLRFLKEVNEKMRELPPEMAKNKQIRQAAELCEEAAFTPEELEAYEKYWDEVRSERTRIVNARAEGLAEGKAIGLEEGKAIGLEKGEAKGEAKAMIKTVLNSHREGYSIDAIAIVTELTIEQITEILKQHGME
jgi:predicted transposase/invertase (TIGR01784 family)